MKKSILCFIISISFSFIVFGQTEKFSRVKIYTDSKGLQKLQSMGVAIDDGEYRKDAYFSSDFSTKDIELIKQSGLTYEVVIDDVKKFYVERNLNNATNDTKLSRSGCSSVPNYAVPSHYVAGSMGGYYTLNEIYTQLDNMRAAYPALISVKQQAGVVNSIENRMIYFVRISDNPDVEEAEPKILYYGLEHAREPEGMQQLIFFMWYLLENYATNTEIQNILNNTELYFIPCTNPDGYNYNYTTDPGGGGMWRKNRRNNGGTYGVDLNRNFGYQWGYDDIGSSPNSGDDTYRGTTGFSEPETQVIKWFCEHHTFRIVMDNHCYGNYLLHPWGYYDGTCPDNNIYQAYSPLLTAENGFKSGNVWECLAYNANGSSFDWMYGEQSTKAKIIGFGAEAGSSSDGFWPAQNRIVDICKSYISMNLLLAKLVGRYAHVEDVTPKFISQVNSKIHYNIECLGLDTPATYTVSLTPISSNIQSVGAPKIHSNMQLLQTINDSISITLNPSIQAGDPIDFMINVNNGIHTSSDTIHKIYGQPIIVLNDICSTIANWTVTNPWNTTTSTFYSSPSSITDSPGGNYNSFVNKSITLTTNIDLSGDTFAQLSYRAKWETEAGFDYVQIKISTDNGTSWTPLCGKYTKTGTADEDPGNPVYDGVQSSWVLETIDISDYVGQQVKFRFTIKSDGWSNYDGFYFDDFKVEVIPTPTIGINEISSSVTLGLPIPNPANDMFTVSYSISNDINNNMFSVYNALGQIVYSKEISGMGTITIDVSKWESGVYSYSITSKGVRSRTYKIVKL